MRSSIALALSLSLASVAEAAPGSLEIVEVTGSVLGRGPSEKEFKVMTKGATLEPGSRVKTPVGGRARVRYPDGTETVVEEESEALLDVGSEDQPSSASLFLGRVWAKVAHATGSGSSYEVRSANAVAGVRGTVLEVGVGLDGSARVVVDEGKVVVDGEEGSSNVGAGQLVEASSSGRVGRVSKTPEDRDWSGWFSARAKKMEAEGLAVAKSLNGRLKTRKTQLKKLIDEQRGLRREIQALEKADKRGERGARAKLEQKMQRLERVTARLRSMRSRVEGAFALFRSWTERTKGLKDGPAIMAMASDVEKVAAEFADMIEEGTDMSEEGMEEMMDDMKSGKSDRPSKNEMDDFLK
ncbi:MAG: FecR domain-containing protein [Deltaproteobacteria bacterium]|nr:FecR domain-containing protein [Deltaproteobacteria bacterium]